MFDFLCDFKDFPRIKSTLSALIQSWLHACTGRALERHSRGQRFEPACLHHRRCTEYSFDIACFDWEVHMSSKSRHRKSKITKSPVRFCMNCIPFVRQYGILDNKWGVLLCQIDKGMLTKSWIPIPR